MAGQSRWPFTQGTGRGRYYCNNIQSAAILPTESLLPLADGAQPAALNRRCASDVMPCIHYSLPNKSCYFQTWLLKLDRWMPPECERMDARSSGFTENARNTDHAGDDVKCPVHQTRTRRKRSCLLRFGRARGRDSGMLSSAPVSSPSSPACFSY